MGIERKHPLRVSVFYPCFNEEQNISGLVEETISVLDELVDTYEILIVDDGSKDRTGLIAENLSNKYNKVRAIHHVSNRGYGAALISGFNNAKFEWVFFTDGDHQFNIREIDRFLEATGKFDRVLGYRKDRRDPRHRLIFAKAWNWLVKKSFSLEIRDINCAFKLIRKNLLKNITLVSSGAVINTEMLVKTGLKSSRTLELPVSHKPRIYGKQTGSNLKVIITAFVELFRLYREIESNDGQISIKEDAGMDTEKLTRLREEQQKISFTENELKEHCRR